MKKSNVLLTVITLFAALLICNGVMAQGKIRKFVSSEGGEFMLVQGINALIRSDSNSVFIEMIAPKQQRAKQYNTVDLQEKDIIMMCNGKRIKDVKQLENMIGKLKVGDEIKLGIKRGKEMLIASFPKADPKAGGHMMIRQTIDSDGGGSGQNMLSINGKNYEDASILDVGIIFTSKKNQLTVVAVLPHVGDKIKGNLPEEGDLIVSINGNVEASHFEMMNLYNGIEDGTEVKIVFARDGKDYTVTFTKEPVGGGIKVIKE